MVNRNRSACRLFLADSVGLLPAWAQDRIRQAGEAEIERYREQYVEVREQKSGGLERVLR